MLMGKGFFGRKSLFLNGERRLWKGYCYEDRRIENYRRV